MGSGTSSKRASGTANATTGGTTVAAERATPASPLSNLTDDELDNMEMDLQARWMGTRSRKARDAIQEELSTIYEERMRRR